MTDSRALQLQGAWGVGGLFPVPDLHVFVIFALSILILDLRWTQRLMGKA